MASPRLLSRKPHRHGLDPAAANRSGHGHQPEVFFISGYKSLWHRAPNMDTLVALGATAAFVYSTYALFAMTAAQAAGDMAAVADYMMEFYFESRP